MWTVVRTPSEHLGSSKHLQYQHPPFAWISWLQRVMVLITVVHLIHKLLQRDNDPVTRQWQEEVLLHRTVLYGLCALREQCSHQVFLPLRLVEVICPVKDDLKKDEHLNILMPNE